MSFLQIESFNNGKGTETTTHIIPSETIVRIGPLTGPISEEPAPEKADFSKSSGEFGQVGIGKGAIIRHRESFEEYVYRTRNPLANSVLVQQIGNTVNYYCMPQKIEQVAALIHGLVSLCTPSPKANAPTRAQGRAATRAGITGRPTP